MTNPQDEPKPRLLLVSLSTILGGAETYYVKLARILIPHYEVIALVHATELAEQMRAVGVTVRLRPARSGVLRYLAAARDLWRTVREFRPACVHLNGAHETYLAPVLRSLGTPYCLSRHNPFDTPPLRPRAKLHFLVHQLRAARRVICIQSAIHAEMAAFLQPEQLVLIPTWVPRVGIPRPLRPTPSTTPFKLLYVGRLIPQKGVLDLIHAMNGLDGVSLDIVGDGPQEALCRAEARGLPITFHGFARHVDAHLDAADLLVFTSHEGYEGLPQVPLEAMAAGLPCLASDIVCTREIYGDLRETALFPAGDVEALRRGILALRADAERLATLSHAGVALIAGRYTEAAVAPLYLATFQATCEARTP